MASQAVTHGLPLPRWQSNWPIFVVPSFVRLHDYKPQKTWGLRSLFKKKSSEYGAEDVISLKWVTDDSKEESVAAVVASEDDQKTRNGITLEEYGSLEATMKLLLVQAAARKDVIAAQEQRIVDLQRRVAPSSELTAAQEEMIVDLQRRVAQLEFNAAQLQMIVDLQREVAQLELNAESKSKTKTPPTEIHAQSKSKIKIPPAKIHPQSKSKTKTPPTEIHVQSKSKTKTPPPKIHTQSKSKTKTPPTEIHVQSKSKTKTPPTENHVPGDGETDEQRERTPLVNFSVSSDKEEHIGVQDDYAMVAMNALQRMQLDLNAESKSKMETSLKTPQTEIRVLSDGETDEEELSADEDEQREKTPLVNFSASSDGDEQSGFKDDDYTMAVMNVLLRTQLEQNAESKSKMETPLKTPQTETQLSDGETDEEEHSSDVDEQRERTKLVNFSASSDEEKHAGFKDDDYANAVMNQISKPQKMRFSKKNRKNVKNEVHLRD